MRSGGSIGWRGSGQEVNVTFITASHSSIWFVENLVHAEDEPHTHGLLSGLAVDCGGGVSKSTSRRKRNRNPFEVINPRVTHRVSDLQVGALPAARQRLAVLAGGGEGQADVLRVVPHRQLHLGADVLRRPAAAYVRQAMCPPTRGNRDTQLTSW